MGDEFNTEIPQDLRRLYETFILSRLNAGFRDEDVYDMRGWWLNNGMPEKWSGGRAHFPDIWKKPNHPTFSNESIYDDGTSGFWLGDMFYRPDIRD